MAPTKITLLAVLAATHAGGLLTLNHQNVDSVAFASENRLRIINEVNHNPASSWVAEVPSRFVGSPYSTLLADGAGILGGDPRENAAGLPTKTWDQLAPRAGLDAAAPAIPQAFNSSLHWPQCPIIAEIQDQSACGSCYAVSTASAASDRYCIAKNGTATPVRMADVDLMSCCFTCKGSNGGCFGGTPSHCWDYMTQQGIASGGQYGDHTGCLMYPFAKCSHHINGTYPNCPAKTYSSPTCFWKCDPDSSSKVTYDASQAAHTFGTSYKVDATVAAIQADIMAHGPVNAGMFLVPEFEVYKSGVFSTTNTNYIGAHAVTIVGWGTDTSTAGGWKDYWTVRNSWNSEWGENGYFRIERGKDNLAIEQSVVGGTMDKW